MHSWRGGIHHCLADGLIIAMTELQQVIAHAGH